MTATYVTTNQTTIETLNGDDFLFVLDTGSITTLNLAVDVDTGDQNRVQIEGTISSALGGAALIGAPATNSVFVVGEGGSVINGSSTGSGVFNAGSDTSIVNAGAIFGEFGVGSDGDNLDIINSGLIFGTVVDGISVDGTNTDITNTGDILGDRYGISAGLFGVSDVERLAISNSGVISGATAILINEGSDHVIQNGGTLMGTQFSYFGEVGALVRIENLGDMLGAAVFGNGADTFINSARMIGSVEMRSGADVLDNRGGLIEGNVDLGNGFDVFDGRGGTVTGAVLGGLGDDTFIVDDTGIALIENAGQGVDTVETEVNYTLADNFETLTLLGAENIDGTGNGDANTLTGNAGANLLQGLGGHDTLDGGAGKDELIGGGGNDELNGDDGDDLLLGRLGNDTLSGGNGDDTLVGGPGTDNLGGGPGNDVLFGGPGADVLNGGSGQDRFVFTKLSDTPAGTEDKIYGFVTGEDTVDLSHLFADPLAMAIGGAFTGTGPSARTTEVGADTRVMIDIDGDSTIDMRLIIKGALGLTETDFFL